MRSLATLARTVRHRIDRDIAWWRLPDQLLPRWSVPLIGALFGVALALRLWGLRHGLPLVYNVDEQAHFVPRAVGFFGHDYDPRYFVNPPAYTYLVHGVLWTWFGGGGSPTRHS